jgi:hypothetical protein
MKLRRILVVVLVVLLVPVGRVLAAPALQEAPAVPGMVQVLQWIAAGLHGPVVSLFLERSLWFQGLDWRRKWYVVLGLNVGLSLLAVALLAYVPGRIWEALAPFWVAAGLTVVNILGGQIMHWADKLSAPPTVADA